MSLDGFVAGPDQSREAPLGVGGERLHEWLLATRSWRRLARMEGGETGVDDDFAARSTTGFGATIIGRNMFGPIRGPWGNENWTGWWGDEPPFHHPVFVLTNHPRPSVAMEGGTVFHFVDDGIESALAQAREAAGDADIRIGGGAETIRQFLTRRLIDEIHVAVVPILLRRGSRLFESVDEGWDDYECVEYVASSSVAHVVLGRQT